MSRQCVFVGEYFHTSRQNGIVHRRRIRHGHGPKLANLYHTIFGESWNSVGQALQEENACAPPLATEVIFEKADHPGSFFRRFPIHRMLISTLANSYSSEARSGVIEARWHLRLEQKAHASPECGVSNAA